MIDQPKLCAKGASGKGILSKVCAGDVEENENSADEAMGVQYRAAGGDGEMERIEKAWKESKCNECNIS